MRSALFLSPLMLMPRQLTLLRLLRLPRLLKQPRLLRPLVPPSLFPLSPLQNLRERRRRIRE
ncbi:MAG TPA: hypothetical protein EYN91_13905 [Candidatus Melainabacteria bacterium]|nr:hypothetical protein [Candidatus Melainabacteria bacterium]HIN67599.1 hypothetical protein [Candidatus Obscuribacterales bacterium]